MSLYACDFDAPSPLRRRSVSIDVLLRGTGVVALVACSGLVAAGLLFGHPGDQTPSTPVARAREVPKAIATEAMLAVSSITARTAHLFGQSAPLRAGLQRSDAAKAEPTLQSAPTTAVQMQVETSVTAAEQFGPLALPPVVEMAETERAVPLPLPRPAELGSKLLAGTKRTAVTPAIVPEATPADPRGLFERLFGSSAQPSGPALAYANPNDGVGLSKDRPVVVAPAVVDRTTAVYDIAAKVVHMPDGTRLEAHSGLREYLDDPKFAHVRMRGVTPPATYDLKLRETLFHGVQAIRLTPVDSNVHGRVGLLAHTYMLGPNGDSNGCVSFRDYDAFLQAYLAGKVKRLTVVSRL